MIPARKARRLFARMSYFFDQFVRQRFEPAELVLLRSKLLFGIRFCQLALLSKIRRGFEVRLCAVERRFDLWSVISD